jgi:dipeptidase D
VVVATGSESVFEDALEAELAALREQHAGTDDGIAVSVETANVPVSSSPDRTALALDLLSAIPSGVVAMSQDAAGSVETSTSLNVATTEGGFLTLASMTRSANEPALDDVVTIIEAAARTAGADLEVVRSYPPWRPEPGSALLATARQTFARTFGFQPGLEVVHGGLECAVIGGKLPGVEMLAIGPTIGGPHASGERLGISSTQRFYRLLTALLDDLSR